MKDSPYQLILITVIPSFVEMEASSYALKIFERLSDFQELGCDVLMLTKKDPNNAGMSIMWKLTSVTDIENLKSILRFPSKLKLRL